MRPIEWLKNNHRKVFGYCFLSIFFLLTLISGKITFLMFIYLWCSFIVLFISFWAFGRTQKAIPAIILTFHIGIVGTIITTLNWDLVGKSLNTFVALLVICNVGQIIYFVLERHKIFGKINRLY